MRSQNIAVAGLVVSVLGRNNQESAEELEAKARALLNKAAS